jgi:hypothetical protein
MKTKWPFISSGCCVLMFCGCVSSPGVSDSALDFQRQSHIYSDDFSGNLKRIEKTSDAIVYLQGLLDTNAEHGFPSYVVYAEAALLKERGPAEYGGDPFDEIDGKKETGMPVIPRSGGYFMSAADAFDLFCDLTSTKWTLDENRVLISARRE